MKKQELWRGIFFTSKDTKHAKGKFNAKTPRRSAASRNQSTGSEIENLLLRICYLSLWEAGSENLAEKAEFSDIALRSRKGEELAAKKLKSQKMGGPGETEKWINHKERRDRKKHERKDRDFILNRRKTEVTERKHPAGIMNSIYQMDSAAAESTEGREGNEEEIAKAF